jgi:hypothetical protein
MTEMQSLLPPPEVIQEQQSITIRHVRLSQSEGRKLDTRFGVTNLGTGIATPIKATIYRIADPCVLGYIPSKLWYKPSNDDIYLLYYTSPTLPAAARPFGDKPCFVFTRRVKDDETIDYPIDARVLIDQLMIDGEMFYIFMFADDQAKSILVTDYDGNLWPVDVPEAALYKGEV